MEHTDVQDVVKKIRALENKVNFHAGALQTRQKLVNDYTLALANHKAEVELLDKVKTVLSHLLENTSKKDLRGMDNLVTYGLKSVYPEKNLEFRSEIVDSGKKVYVDMDTYRNGNKASKDAKGSITVIESLLIRILSILKKGGARFILADEPFSAIGNDHISNVGVLLEELAKKLGMDILLVTHNPGVSDSCMFRATLQEGDSLKLSKIGGSDKAGSVEEEAKPVSVDSVEEADLVPKKKSRAPSKKKAGV